MSAFDTATGIPLGVVNLAENVTGASQWAGGASSVLSELGSNQVRCLPLHALPRHHDATPNRFGQAMRCVQRDGLRSQG